MERHVLASVADLTLASLKNHFATCEDHEVAGCFYLSRI